MTLYKRNSTADTFLGIYIYFFEQAISQNSFKPLAVKGFYFLRMSIDYCFGKAAQRQLSQCNRINSKW